MQPRLKLGAQGLCQEAHLFYKFPQNVSWNVVGSYEHKLCKYSKSLLVYNSALVYL